MAVASDLPLVVVVVPRPAMVVRLVMVLFLPVVQRPLVAGLVATERYSGASEQLAPHRAEAEEALRNGFCPEQLPGVVEPQVE